MRSPVAIRPATRADLPSLLGLWLEARDNWRQGERSRLVQAPTAVAARLEALVGCGDVQVLVATAGDEPVGMTMLVPTTVGVVPELRALQMSHTVVASSSRHRGVGRALVAAATAYAEELGLGTLLVDVPTGLREAHRFYARLGFAPAVTRRAAPVSELRRRLAAPARRPPVGDIVRRRARNRTLLSAADGLGLPQVSSRPVLPQG